MATPGTIEVDLALQGSPSGPVALRFPDAVGDSVNVSYVNWPLTTSNIPVPANWRFFLLVPSAGNTVPITVNTLAIDPGSPLLLGVDPANSAFSPIVFVVGGTVTVEMRFF